jgi:excisionase family DNA binding protein
VIGRSRLLTVAEVADRLAISQKTVRNWLSLRKLTYVKLGARTRIPESEVDKLLERSTVPALR